jgi:thioredoxin reductase (NADPH)
VAASDLDLAVVGAGTTGLAAAIQAAADGLRVALLERASFGGRLLGTVRVEMVPGLPVGMTGAEFTARATALAARYGVEMRGGVEAVGLEAEGDRRLLRLGDGAAVAARAVIVATGTEYPPLPTPRLREFTGSGVYFGIPGVLPESLRAHDAFVTGASGAATDAALLLSRVCRAVVLLPAPTSVFPPELAALLRGRQNVLVRPQWEIVEAVGVERLEALVLRHRSTGRSRVRSAAGLFVLGTDRPRTEWLAGVLALDAGGYVLTGADARPIPAAHPGPPPSRSPLPLETSLPGVFATGGARGTRDCCVETAGAEGIAAARYALTYLDGHAQPVCSRGPADSSKSDPPTRRRFHP